jgi:hypothetical protein
MNVPLAQLRDSLKVRESQAAVPSGVPTGKTRGARGRAAPAAAAAGAVDPMQWWGALTKQFTQLAASAMKDSAGDAAKSLASTMVKQSFDAAEQTLKKAVTAPAKVAGAVAKAAGARRRTTRR